MEGPTLRVRCACGWEVVGREVEVVPATQEHGRRLHNMNASREQVLAMATSDPEADAGAASASAPADVGEAG